MHTTLELNNDAFVLGIPIMKVDAEKRIVGGFATLDNVDKAKDILDFSASKDAFSAWPGNVREMHEKKAVGRAVNVKEDQYLDKNTGNTYDGMWVEAKISKGAEDTWQKVLDGTLSGFSVGGAIHEKQREMRKAADGSDEPVWRVTKYSLNELSLVDNPCNGLAGISLIKSINGNLEETEVLEKAGTTQVPMKPMQPAEQQAPEPQDTDMPDIESIIKALSAWRDKEVKEGDDHDLAFISTLIQQLKERVFRGDPGEHGNDNAIFGQKDQAAATDAPAATQKPVAKKPVSKSIEGVNILQDNELSDISVVEELNDESKSLVKEFVKFLFNKTTSKEQVEKDGDDTEMDEAMLKTAVDTAVETLTKSADEKFGQVGESLTKVAEALEKLATVEAVEEIKKGFDEGVAALVARVEALENSGAIQKSGDDAGEEKLEKSDKKTGLWAGSLVPEFLQAKYQAGR